MLQTTTEALDWAVETALKINEWDMVPMLLATRDTGVSEFVALAGDDLFGMLATLGPVLRREDSAVTGLILMNEGWGLSASRVEAGAMTNLRAEVAELRRTGRGFADHPAAVELKMFTAIDAEGVEVRKIERGNSEAQSTDGGAAGQVIDLIKALFEEVTA